MTRVRGRVLSVASECVPLLKTGGLADVVGALPAALAAEGWEMRVLMPCYRPLLWRLDGMTEVFADDHLFGGRGRVMAGEVAGRQVLLLDAPHLYDREGGPYTASGATTLGGECPVNVSGGLVSKGHPIAATGIIQLHELTTQLRGEAGARQVQNARIAVAENGGGFLRVEDAAAVVTVLDKA